MKKAKTPLFDLMRKVFSLAKEANQRQMSAQDLLAEHQARALSRRKFLETTGKTLALGGITAYLSACSKENSLLSSGAESQSLIDNIAERQKHDKNARIAIIGGGIAGLNALHTFRKAHINATVYEASNRTSGRIFSVQNAMGPNTWAEFGAEFIDTEHREMRALAQELGLEIIDTQVPSELRLIKEAYFFDGRHHSLAEVIEEFRKFSDKMQADIDSLPEEISYISSTPIAKKFDRMSLSQYLRSIGARGWIKRLIEVAYEAEYGLSPSVQSSLNLLTFIDTDTEHGEFKIFGDSDERYKVKGGNMRIPDGLAAKYPEHIKLNHKLTAIKEKRGHGYELSFDGCDRIVADYVVLALPFTTLRKVYIDVPMPRIKRQVIDRLNYASTTKLMIGFNNHHWRSLGYAGFTFTDDIQTGWDNAQLETPDNQAAGFTILLGGPAGIALQQGSPESQKNIWLPRIEEVYKGVTPHHNGKVARMNWPSYPFNLGCYVCYTVGQWTTLSGAENLPVGNIHFAGEHLVSNSQGFMDGAALTGREAAEAILEKIQV